MATNLFGFFQDLIDEYDYVMEDMPRAASQTAANWFPHQKKGYDNQKDAARHALWSAQLAARYGQLPAQMMTTAWEVPGLFPASGSTLMDLHNNAVGRQVVEESEDWDEVLRKIQRMAVTARPEMPVGLFDQGPEGRLITIDPGLYKY